MNPKFSSDPIIENKYLIKQWISASIASSNLSCIQLALNSLSELYTCPEVVEFSVKEYWPLLSDIIHGFCRILKEEVNGRKSIEKLLDAHAKIIFRLIGTPLCKEWKGPDNLQKRAQTMTLWLKNLASIRHGTVPDAMAISCYYIHLKAAKIEGSPPIYGPSNKELNELEKDLLTLKTN